MYSACQAGRREGGKWAGQGLDGRMSLDATTEYHILVLPWESAHTPKRSEEPRRSHPPETNHLGGCLSPPVPEDRNEAQKVTKTKIPPSEFI